MGYTGDKKRAYQREWMRRRRNAWLEENGPCVQCGSSTDLEVDHIDPATKALEVRGVWSLSAAKREVELAKCQVLCQECHKEKTQAPRRTAPEHGRAAYQKGCRCVACREAHRVHNAKYR